MKNPFGKIAIATALSTILPLTIVHPAQAISFNFNWQGDFNGYTVKGTFGYDETTAPTIITESGAGATNTLDFLTVSFFDPSNNPLESFNTVAGGVSNSAFFAFNFDTSTQTLFGNFNVGGGTSTDRTQLFGTIGDVLRLLEIGSFDGLFLDLQYPGVVTVTEKVPEPSSILGVLALGVIGAGSLLKKKQA
jgi:hypothetical protein